MEGAAMTGGESAVRIRGQEFRTICCKNIQYNMLVQIS